MRTRAGSRPRFLIQAEQSRLAELDRARLQDFDEVDKLWGTPTPTGRNARTSRRSVGNWRRSRSAKSRIQKRRHTRENDVSRRLQTEEYLIERAQPPGTSIADAYLYRVNRCTGQQTLICYVHHNNTPVPGTCRQCQFASTTFEFANYLYYVRVVLDRNTAAEQPAAQTLRIS